MKRTIDILVSAFLLLAASPVLLVCMFLVWRQDGHSPFYVPDRSGRSGRPFPMIKLRSMIVNADRSGVNSTGADDARITPVGHFIRRYKLDEITQMWNVLRGDMSLVGPRPNVPSETELYTPAEKRLLSVKPGVTDFSSIVFADEGAILAGHPDPDMAYNQLIRPWKSRLGLYYIDHASAGLDLRLVWLTALAIVSRGRALEGVARLLDRLGAPADLVRVARRAEALEPVPPPGAAEIAAAG
jgi:lipopolysaccharide/colanic/teichoic acid biosynthesis glycosyltransferase